jgi:hypothetical protein
MNLGGDADRVRQTKLGSTKRGTGLSTGSRHHALKPGVPSGAYGFESRPRHSSPGSPSSAMSVAAAVADLLPGAAGTVTVRCGRLKTARAAADGSVVRRITVLSALAALVFAGGAYAVDPAALRLAAHNVLEARPAAEVYWLQHGNSYSGMTTAKLAPIGAGHGGPIRARVIWATRTNYCLQSTVRTTTVHAFSVVVSRLAVYGPCPRRP